MTRSGLNRRWRALCAQARMLRDGLPHGCDPFVDVRRRLTRTKVDVVCDVGANHGQTAAAIRNWYPEATIHCFEPVPATFAVLRASTHRDSRIHAHPIGLSDARRSVPMATSPDDRRATVVSSGSTGSSSPVAELETLDQFCNGRSVARIDYLKIDTEVHALAVLKGGAVLLRDGGVSIIEVEAGMHRDKRFHVRMSDFIDHLEPLGYRLFGIYEQTLECPTADAHLRRATLLFVSAETIDQNRWIDNSVADHIAHRI